MSVWGSVAQQHVLEWIPYHYNKQFERIGLAHCGLLVGLENLSGFVR